MTAAIAIGMALSAFALHALGMRWARAVAFVVGIVAAAVVLTVILGEIISR